MAKTILVVEDSSTALSLIQSTLSKEGYNILTAVNGEECLELANTASPDLILLDVEMPKMDGYTTLLELKSGRNKKKTRDIPVVILTTKERLEDIFELEGAKGFIKKSQTAFQTLPQKISEFLS